MICIFFLRQCHNEQWPTNILNEYMIDNKWQGEERHAAINEVERAVGLLD